MPQLAESALRFTRAEYESRLDNVRRSMERQGLDLLYIADPSNMNWLTGYDGWSFYVHQGVIVTLDEPPIWFGRGQDRAGAARTAYMDQGRMIGYPDYYVQSTERHPMDALAALITDRGWGGRTIGLELENYYFSAAAYLALCRGLPNARLRDATNLVNWCRAVKSPAELTAMRIAARIVERMHARIAELAEPGMRKCDLVAEIMAAGIRGLPDVGGDYAAIVPLLPSGADAAAPHLTWDDRPLRSGEGTFFEIAGCYRRYHCPLSRSLFLGTPPPHLLAAEKAVLEGLEAGLAAARPGKRCADIADAFFDVLARYGIEKDNRAGYSIGLGYPPDWGERTMSLRRGDGTVLEPGMAFHFMTGLWQQDWGLEITESIVITEAGVEILADVPRALLVKT